ncbi:endolytic transglycosylase MltG [Anaeromicropila populeti]|nr:endolytic transglycosylase MltG [Anaeromicropila populeti]
MKSGKIIITILIIAILAVALPSQTVGVKAASEVKQYGILIGNQKGSYMYYDLNGVTGTQRIEVSKNGTVMIPLKKICSYMPDLSYEFSYETKKATITNKKTDKKIVLTENSLYAYTYAGKSSAGKKVKLGAKMYLSPDSNAAMADKKVFQYIFKTTKGYRYYSNGTSSGAKKILAAKYDKEDIGGLIIYNPYKSVTKLPAATVVSYYSDKAASNTVKVTIPEGYSVAQTAVLLVKKGVCQSTQAVLNACNQVDTTKYWFFEGMTPSEERCFLLEGYLYPSTYEFYKNSNPGDVVSKILKNTENMLTKEQQTRADELGYSLDEVLTMASIIEKEIAISSERTKVSSILHNRLKSGMKIQCDATIYYVEKYIKPYISGDIDRYSKYYNTYKCSGLPAGPICSPGREAIQAALYPEENEYLYFCSDKNGNYYYASTYQEHLENMNNLIEG